jgi:hypothetical protein
MRRGGDPMEIPESAGGKEYAAGGKRKAPPNLHILWLTFLFFATGMAMFLAAMAVAVGALPDLVRLSLRVPQGWFAAHLLLPGFATMVAMGASFQITQVILRTPLYSRTLGFVQYGLCLFGLIFLLAGFFADGRWIALGGGCFALGGLLYAFNLAVTYIRKKERNLFVFGTGLSLAALLANLSLGIAMGVGYFRGWPAARQDILFENHLWFGVGGWLAGLIMVYSYKLLPMFYVSRKKWTDSSCVTVGLFHFGVWLHALALWTGAERLAVPADLAVLVAWGWFVVQIREIRRQSRGRQPIGAVKVAYVLLYAAGLWFLVRCVLVWSGLGSARLEEALVAGLVLGWFAPTILGYLSKILPFLWWAHRFRTGWQKKSAVALSDMLPEQRLTRELTGYLAGVAVMVAGFWGHLPSMAVTGQTIAYAFVLVYLVELLRVFRH